MEKVVDYDSENDILYVNKGKRVKDSLEIDNFIIDFSYRGKIVGMEILNASESISSLVDSKITKEDLKNVEEAQVIVKKGKGAIFIKLAIKFLRGKKVSKNHLSLSIPAEVSEV